MKRYVPIILFGLGAFTFHLAYSLYIRGFHPLIQSAILILSIALVIAGIILTVSRKSKKEALINFLLLGIILLSTWLIQIKLFDGQSQVGQRNYRSTQPIK